MRGHYSFPLITPLYPWYVPYITVLRKEVSSTILKVFGMMQPGIEPRFRGPLANTLLTRPMSLYTFRIRIQKNTNYRYFVVLQNCRKIRTSTYISNGDYVFITQISIFFEVSKNYHGIQTPKLMPGNHCLIFSDMWQWYGHT